MKDEWIEYLKSVDVSETLQAHIQSVFQEFSPFFPERIDRIFITDHIDEQGIRRHSNLWYFTKSFSLETKDITSGDNIDMIGHSSSMTYVSIKKESFGITDYNDKSRLFVEVKFVEGLYAEFRATRNNCIVLADIIKNVYLPEFLYLAKT